MYLPIYTQLPVIHEVLFLVSSSWPEEEGFLLETTETQINHALNQMDALLRNCFPLTHKQHLTFQQDISMM